MLEKHLCTSTSTNECMYWGGEGHTGVALVSRCDCPSSDVLHSPHYLQTTSAYMPDLGHLAVLFLYVSRNERYGCKLRRSAARSRYKLGFLISEDVRGGM